MTDMARTRSRRQEELLRFARFVAVGVFNTLFGYLVFATLWYLTHNNAIAVILGTVINVAFNYFTTGRFVFANRGFQAMLPYFGGYAILMVLNLTAIEVMTRAGISAPIAGLIALPFMVIFSYTYNRLVVFRKTSK